jgi:hypothetical protein
MKLWVEPVSMSAMKDAAARSTWRWMVLLTGTPATACKEKTGASASGVSSAATSSEVAMSTPLM